MCIIAAKPAGVDMPSMDTIENMWTRNKDGAGIMWASDGTVHIEKGFMKLADFKARLAEISDKYDMKKTACVMHFRITTHGGTKPENCHPFPVTESVGSLKKLKNHAKVGVAHNGIIRSVTPRAGISDTMEYVATQLGPLSMAIPQFYKDANLLRMIENAIGSKMAFLDERGHITTIGKFIESDGMLYSNDSFRGYKDMYQYYGYGDNYFERFDPYFFDTPKTQKDVEKAGRTKYSWKQVEMRLMWLYGYERDVHIRMDDGEWIEPDDFAIDAHGTVYAFDYESGCFVEQYGAVAEYDISMRPVEFDPTSEDTLSELVWIETVEELH